MAGLTLGMDVGHRGGTTFYVWMAVTCVLIAFGGFSVTYFVPMAMGTVRDISPAVHIHGALFFCWTLMVLAQTWLVAQGRIVNHRAVGTAGISLATAMVIFGCIVSLYAGARRFNAGELQSAYYSLLLGWSSMLAFTGLVGFAFANTRRPDTHKRLMLLATLAILGAAVARMYVPFFEGPALNVPRVLTNGTIDLLIVVMLVYDWRTIGRPHTATLVGGATLLAIQLIRGPLSDTELWHSTARSLFAMAV